MDGQTDGQKNGQTYVGHINLIGGLITRNPPKNKRRTCIKFSILKYSNLTFRPIPEFITLKNLMCAYRNFILQFITSNNANFLLNRFSRLVSENKNY